MKKSYHIVFAFLIGITLANCNKDVEGDLEINSEFCKQMTDTTGLNLYYFTPFTEHEWKYESYDYKVQRRQLPEHVLKSLTLEQLLLQCVWLDMTPDLLLT